MQVKLWITFNEPFVVSWLGHGAGMFAPGINEPGSTPYIVTHNIIRAHVKAYHTYSDHFRSRFHGNCNYRIYNVVLFSAAISGDILIVLFTV